MNSKQWAKVRMNQSTKTLTMTKQIFTSQQLGMESLGVSKTFVILNQKGIEKLLSEGWSIVDTKSTNNITKVETVKEVWQPQYLVGGSIEEEIRSYVSSKKQKQAVHFVKGLHEINEKSKVSALEVFGESKFKSEKPFDNSNAMDRFTRNQKRMKHYQESEVVAQ